MAKSIKEGMVDRNAVYHVDRGWTIHYLDISKNGNVKSRPLSGFETADEANEKYDELNRKYEMQARKLGLATKMDGDINLSEFLRYYLEEILAAYCAPATKAVFSYTLYRNILPILENDIELKYINSDYLNQILDLVGKKSATASNKAREFLFLALKQAKKECRISQIPKMKPCPAKKTNIEVLSKDEIKALLKVAANSNWYLEILLALFCGMRKGEILALKFSDFDKEAQAVSIERQLSFSVNLEPETCQVLSSQKVEKDPKTDNSVRTIYVPQIIWDELEVRKDKIASDKLRYTDTYEDNDYISCTELGQAHGTSAMNLALTKLCKRNGLKHITVHGLRHCYATILLEQSYELPVVSALLGHSSINTTFEFYADIMDANVEISTVLNELYASEDETDE